MFIYHKYEHKDILFQFQHFYSYLCGDYTNAVWYWDRSSVCSSVTRNHERLNGDKKKRPTADVPIPYEREIHLVFKNR